MTKHQAISEMMKGEKVKHELFHDGEYLFMKGDFGIYTEEGYKVTDEFWKLRFTPNWVDGGWAVVPK